jgi:hypothetical protein
LGRLHYHQHPRMKKCNPRQCKKINEKGVWPGNLLQKKNGE